MCGKGTLGPAAWVGATRWLYDASAPCGHFSPVADILPRASQARVGCETDTFAGDRAVFVSHARHDPSSVNDGHW